MDELEKIEAVKKEADSLMMNKINKYEAKIAELKKELEETRNDNKKLADQVNNQIDQLRRAGVI